MSNFVICINKEGNLTSFILGKVYRTLPDLEAAKHKLLRVVDEDQSESDGYLYPETMFATIKLPEVAEQALMATN